MLFPLPTRNTVGTGIAVVLNMKYLAMTVVSSITALAVLSLLFFVWLMGMPGLSILVDRGFGN
jgi:hypothetical protein